MNFKGKITAIFGIALLAGCTQVSPEPTESAAEELFVQSLSDAPKNLETLVNRVSAATYEIGCEEGSGSAWAATLYLKGEQEDFLVTNQHVVEDCLDKGEVDVWDSDGNSFTAEISVAKYQDDDYQKERPSIDLALLKVNKDRLVTLNEVSGSLSLGNWVMTMSYPANYQTSGVVTMTSGVVSADAGLQG
jgi:hypothetical protein